MARRKELFTAALALTIAAPASAQVARRSAPAAPPAAAQAPADVALIGVTQVGDRTRAWLIDLRTRRRETVAAGEAAFGFRVKRIAGESVVLSRGGKELTLRLGDKPIPPRVATRPTAVVPGDVRPGSIRPGALPPVLTPEGEVPLRMQVVPGTVPPAAGSVGEVAVVPSPIPAEPEPAYPYPNVYPGLNPIVDPYTGQFYGYPGMAPGYDPYTGQFFPYNPYGATPGYYPGDPYGYYPAYPSPVLGYAPYGTSLPGATGFSAPWGAYPNQSGTGPISGGLRWNPQTHRRTGGGPYLDVSPNPQTRRRRRY